MTHKNIYTALSAAQKNMGAVVKGSVNPHFKSKYADLADVMSVALPALNEQGISVWHSMAVVDGRDYMRTTLSHGESETHVSCDVPLVNVKQDMQGMKSATTYAKRIGIESLAGIAPEDDDGNAASAPVKPEPLVDTEKAAEIDLLITEVKADKAAFLGYFKIDDVRKLKAKDYATAKAMLNRKAGAA
jgi:hypothetical protein